MLPSVCTRLRDSRGMATTTASIGGLVLVVSLFTAGVTLAQIYGTHAVLAKASQVAVRSEQQQGCWTSETSNVATNVFHGSNFSGQSVNVTHATLTPTLYGHSVVAGFSTKVPIRVWGMKVTSMTVRAQAGSSSFFTPAITGGTLPTCQTPGSMYFTYHPSSSSSSAPSSSASTAPSSTPSYSHSSTPSYSMSMMPRVEHVSVKSGVVTITGVNLPTLSGGSSVYGGQDWSNFLWSQKSSPTTAGQAIGNPHYPYSPDWGAKLIRSTSTELSFTPANSPSGTWYLYLKSSSITSSTSPIWSGTP